jgi:PAS domain S-box-containing protein
MVQPIELQARCGECLLYGAIEGLQEALVLVDGDGRVFHANRRAQEMLALGSRRVTGTMLQDSLRHPGLAEFWSKAMKETVPITTELEIEAGTSVRATSSLCLSANREPIGRALLLRDVTEEKKIKVEISTAVARRLADMADNGEPNKKLPALSHRESEILNLLVEGLSNAEISNRLHVSVNTVASHLKNLYPKLKVSSRTQAISCAVTHGIRPGAR